jgi:hypothetical protein
VLHHVPTPTHNVLNPTFEPKHVHVTSTQPRPREVFSFTTASQRPSCVALYTWFPLRFARFVGEVARRKQKEDAMPG